MTTGVSTRPSGTTGRADFQPALRAEWVKFPVSSTSVAAVQRP